MLNIAQFRQLIVESTLRDLVLYSADAEELLVFTCAVESLGGHFLHQVNGPALGIYQMEPTTHNDLWQNYIKNKSGLFMILLHSFNTTQQPSEERLIYDLRYATAMTRIYYERVPEPIPSANDVDAIWDYYKTHYNTAAGAAEKDASITKYRDFLVPY